MADLQGLVGVLRSEGGDLPGVEVKSAAGGLPDSLLPTLCAFANRPGGGTVILGLDEAEADALGLAIDKRVQPEHGIRPQRYPRLIAKLEHHEALFGNSDYSFLFELLADAQESPLLTYYIDHRCAIDAQHARDLRMRESGSANFQQ